MFNVSCKDPLEAESVGQRRARKTKETKEAVDSINDAISELSISARTPDTPVFAFSPPHSGRSSRTSVVSPRSHKSDSPESKPTKLRDYFNLKSNSSNTKKPSKEKKPVEYMSHGAFNPFGSATTSQATTSRAAGEWRHEIVSTTTDFTLPTATISQTRPGSMMTSMTSVSRPEDSRASIASDGPKPGKRFQRILRRIERANDQSVIARMTERGPEDEDDIEMLYEFEFETSLWALVQAQKISTQLQSLEGVFPVTGRLDKIDREMLSGANILHLGAVKGSPESWYLGTKYSEAIVHSLGLRDLPFDLASSSWGLPSNVLLEQWSEFPHLDYVEGIFDVVVIAHHLFESTKCTLWPVLIEQISRVLAPGGLMIVSVMDTLPQHSGPLLDSWTHQNMTMNILRRFMVHQPSLLLPSWVEEDGHFHQEHIDRIGFPCIPAFGVDDQHGEIARPVSRRRRSYSSQLPTDRLGQIIESTEGSASSTPPTGTKEHLLASSYAGWNFYERLYADFLSTSDDRDSFDLSVKPSSNSSSHAPMRGWCMDSSDGDVWRECQQRRPFFEIVTFAYRRAEYDEVSHPTSRSQPHLSQKR